MKKILAIIFSMIIILSFPLSVSADDMTWTSTNSVILPKNQNEFKVEISINDAEPYAGAEFGVQCPQGVSIKSVTYNKDGSKAGPTEARGLNWFSFFTGENKFSGDTTAVLTLEYKDNKNTSIVIDSISVYTTENKTITTKQATPRKVININREGADNTVKPLDPPEDNTSGSGEDNSDHSGGDVNQNNEGNTKSGGFTTVNSSNTSGDGESQNDMAINNDNEDNQLQIDDQIGNIPSENGNDTRDDNSNNILKLIIGALVISVGVNVVVGYFIIKNKKQKENG